MKLKHIGWGLLLLIFAFAIVFGNDRIREAGLGGAISGAFLGLISGLILCSRWAWVNQRQLFTLPIFLRNSSTQVAPHVPDAMIGPAPGQRRRTRFAVVLALLLGLLASAPNAAEDHAYGLLSLVLGADERDRKAALNAAVGDNVDGLKRPLRRGVSPNSRYSSSATLLGNAVENGSYNAAALLLSYGANPDWRTLKTSANDRAGKTFDTPLHMAVRRCRLDLVRLLIGAGANACLRNAAGRLPYHLSFSCQQPEMGQVFRSVSATSCKEAATPSDIGEEIEPIDREQVDVPAGSPLTAPNPPTALAVLKDAPSGALQLTAHEIADRMRQDPTALALVVDRASGVVVSGQASQTVSSSALPTFQWVSWASSISVLPLHSSSGVVRTVIEDGHQAFELKAGQQVRVFCKYVALVPEVLGDCSIVN